MCHNRPATSPINLSQKILNFAARGPNSSVAQSGVRVRDATQEAEAHDKKWELDRREPDAQAHSDQPYIGNRVLKDVRPVIRPRRHLIFGMVEGMDAVPPPISMGEAMAPIVREVEYYETQQEDKWRPRQEP